MEKLIKDFRNKLKTEGRTLKWFNDQYCSDVKYMSLSQQLNGYYSISIDVENAMKKYLKD